MIAPERLIKRLTNASLAIRPWKEKAYRLRRVVAGDQDALFNNLSNNNKAEGARFSREFRIGSPDILISEFKEGINNEILKSLMILVDQTCYSFPKIEIQGLNSKRQATNNHYLKDVLDSCHAVDHSKMALTDFLMGGTGDLYLPTEDGVPIVRWADSLDIKFDITARMPCDIRWKSLTVCEPIWKWFETFEKQSSALKLIYGDLTDEGMDLPGELEFYYDVEGSDGNYVVLAKTSDHTYHPEPIFTGKNPHFFDYRGKREPYLPFESIFYMMLPSIKFPISAAEKALPDQIGLWRGLTDIKETIDNGGAFYEVKKGTFADEEAREEWLKAKKGGIAEVEEIGNMKEHPPLSPGPTILELTTMHAQGIQTQLGANNYSLGAPVQGVKYAREVNAMQAAGSLTAGAISKANASCWAKFCKKTLASGKRTDTKRNFSFWVEGTQMEFGPKAQAGPISFYLAPEAELIISEDSMRFMPQAQRVELASAMVDKALQGGQIYPNAVGLAYRKYWEACGVENVDEWMQPAPPPQAPPGMAPPGQPDPSQVAGAVPGVSVALPKAGMQGGALPQGNQ